MSFLIDIILIAFYVLIILVGAKKGFIKSLFDMLGSYIALIAAYLIAGTFSKYLYDILIRDYVTNMLIDALPESLAELGGRSGAAILPMLPDGLSSIVETFGIEKLLAGITFPDFGLGIADIESNYFAPVIIKIVQAGASLILFIILRIIIRLLTRALSDLIKNTPLKKVNIALGAVLGGVRGLVGVVIISVALIIVSSFLAKSQFFGLVESSKICGLVGTIIGKIG